MSFLLPDVLFANSISEANMPSVSVKDVNQQAYTVALAAHFKKTGKMKVPEWVDLVKTNVGKELAPYDEDWFYVRCASIARHIYIRWETFLKIFL